MGRLNAASRDTGAGSYSLGLTPQEEADRRNNLLFRQDIEWAVGETGLYLRDKPSWTARRTNELARSAEDERQRWKRAQERKDD